MATIKSIKEKAEEHAPYTENDSWNKIQRCEIAQTSFKAGANAVLDLLQKRLSDRHFTSAAFLQIDIEDFIKELKGE